MSANETSKPIVRQNPLIGPILHPSSPHIENGHRKLDASICLIDGNSKGGTGNPPHEFHVEKPSGARHKAVI